VQKAGQMEDRGSVQVTIVPAGFTRSLLQVAACCCSCAHAPAAPAVRHDVCYSSCSLVTSNPRPTHNSMYGAAPHHPVLCELCCHAACHLGQWRICCCAAPGALTEQVGWQHSLCISTVYLAQTCHPGSATPQTNFPQRISVTASD
jgi:hypothetical protein